MCERERETHPAVLILVFLEDVVDGVQQLLYGTSDVSEIYDK